LTFHIKFTGNADCMNRFRGMCSEGLRRVAAGQTPTTARVDLTRHQHTAPPASCAESKTRLAALILCYSGDLWSSGEKKKPRNLPPVVYALLVLFTR